LSLNRWIAKYVSHEGVKVGNRMNDGERNVDNTLVYFTIHHQRLSRDVGPEANAADGGPVVTEPKVRFKGLPVR